MRRIALFCFLIGIYGIQVFTQTSVGMDMVTVQGGSFLMGTVGMEADTPHRVLLTDFLIGKFEVTQGQYAAVMGKNPSNMQGREVVHIRNILNVAAGRPLETNSNNLPVEKVSWFDAVAFCNALSLREGYIPAYRISGQSVVWQRNANGYRLPTEAEWEFAARGGSMSTQLEFAGSNDVLEVAWTHSECLTGSQPLGQRAVGLKQPNELGLYDMSGNVWEWCWDWYGPYPDHDVTNPAGPDSGTGKIYRGGAWNEAPELARVGNRSKYQILFKPESTAGHLGFRVARNM